MWNTKSPFELCSSSRNKEVERNDMYQHNSSRSGPVIEKRGAEYPFPVKLHYMIQDAENRGLDKTISWLPGGEGFKIHNPKKAAKEIFPMWFRQSSYGSFQRQLNIYKFQRIKSGSSKGGYHHDLFVKGKPFLSYGIKRFPMKNSNTGRNNHIQEHCYDTTPPIKIVSSTMAKPYLSLLFQHTKTRNSSGTPLSSRNCSLFLKSVGSSSDTSVLFLQQQDSNNENRKAANHQILLLKNKSGEQASVMDSVFEQEDVNAEIVRTFLPPH